MTGSEEPKIRCRPAELGDVERLAALSGVLQRPHAARHPEMFKPFDQLSGVSLFRDQLARPHAVIVVAETGHLTVGYLMAEVVRNEETAFTRAFTALHIQHLVVDEGFRNHGVGHVLLNQAEHQARHSQCQAVQLACWSFNQSAQAFFTAVGFEPYQVRMTRPAR